MENLKVEERLELGRLLGATTLQGHEEGRIIDASLIFGLYRTHVLVELDNGVRGVAFSFHADEVTAIAEQFIGMKLQEATEAFYAETELV